MDDSTLKGPGGELEAVVAILRDTWRALECTEREMRSLIKKTKGGMRITTAGVAAHLRQCADDLSERSSRLHEAARRIEPFMGSARPPHRKMPPH